MTNLLLNAVDATGMRPREPGEAAGSVTLVLASDDQGASLSVIDDGVGLPQEDRDRLTEPYVTHKPKGTGLGLAIVKKIMEDHGGRLALDDRPDGPGATASLIFPIVGTSDSMTKAAHGA